MLNTRLLAGTLLFLALVGPAMWLWHRYQLTQTAGVLLERADSLVAEEDWLGAADQLYQYLRLRPEDADAKIRLAEVFAHLALAPQFRDRAIEFHYQAIAVAEGEKLVKLRQKLAEMLLDADRYTLAETECLQILAERDYAALQKLGTSPGDVLTTDRQACRVLALSIYGQAATGLLPGGQKAGGFVGEWLALAQAWNPADIELASVLARVYRQSPAWLGPAQRMADGGKPLTDAEREQKSDAIMDSLVAADRDNPQAYLARASYREVNGLAGVREDLTTALAKGPEDLRVLLAAARGALAEARTARSAGAKVPGSAAQAKERLESAGTQFEHALQIAPHAEEAYLGLGEVLLLQEKTKEAIANWQRGLEKCGAQSLRLNLVLAGTWLQEGQHEQSSGALEIVQQQLDLLRQRGNTPSLNVVAGAVDLLAARLALAKKDVAGSQSLLHRVADSPKNSPPEKAQSLQAWMLLGAIDMDANRPDLATEAYEQACLLQPNPALPGPHLVAAAAYMQLGVPQAALRHFERAVAVAPIPETRLQWASVLLASQVRQPKGERDWKVFDKVVADLKQSKESPPLVNPWRLALLAAEATLVRSDEVGQRAQGVRDAATLLRATENDAPRSAALMARLVSLYESLNLQADADRAYGKYVVVAESPIAAALLRASVLTHRKQFDEARKTLHAAMAKVQGPGLSAAGGQADARRSLGAALAQVELVAGRPEEAWNLLRTAIDNGPADALTLLAAIELALELGKLKEAESLEPKLIALEGSEGSQGSQARYWRARRLLLQAKDAQDAAFAEADKLQAQLRQQRPQWAEASVLSGQVHDRAGKAEEALESYRNAVRLGEQRLFVHERIILLLNQLGRVSEADRYLAQLQDRVAASTSLSSMEVASAARLGQWERAVSTAQRGVEVRPQDPMAWVSLGQVRWILRELDAAEKALGKAVEMAPADARTNGPWIAFLARTGKLDRSRQALETYVKKAEVSPAQRAMLLADGYDTIGDSAKADTSYREAERLGQENASIQEMLAAQLVSRDPAAAEKAAQRALQLNPKSALGRRFLAGLLAQRGGEAEWQEALRLLAVDPDDAGASQDRRLQAVLLVRRAGKENLAKARSIVEQLLRQSANPASGDRLLLARVCEAEADYAAAEKEYLKLVEQPNADPAHFASLVAMLLRDDARLRQNNAAARATPWLDKLEKTTPDSPATVEFRARWLLLQNRAAEIEPLVQKLVDRLLKKVPAADANATEPKIQAYLAAGGICGATKQHAAAERWYRQVLALAPDRYAQLATALAKQNRMRDAVTLCAKALETDKTPKAVLVLASVLVAGSLDEDTSRQAEPLLTKAATDFKSSADVLTALANVRIVQKRIDEACALLRQVLALQPNSLVALNNLGALLTERPETLAEGIECIDRAIRIAGPQPTLLDTKGAGLLFQGKAAEALPLLEAAAQTPTPDPRYTFHLAAAYDRLGDAAKAREAFARAKKADLDRQVLTELEKKLAAELQKKYPQ